MSEAKEWFEIVGLIEGKHETIAEIEVGTQPKEVYERQAYQLAERFLNSTYPLKWVYRYGNLDNQEYTGQFQFIDWSIGGLVPAVVRYRNPEAEEIERARREEAAAKTTARAIHEALATPAFTFAEGTLAEWGEFVARNSQDGYSAAIVAFARKWAEIMEPQLAAGAKFADIARKAKNEADTDGITGAMYGAAVATLAHFWEYGDALRQWHNGAFGQPNAQGTVNPAILTSKTQNGK